MKLIDFLKETHTKEQIQDLTHVVENSLYSTEEEYDVLIQDKQRVQKAFLTSFLGVVMYYTLDNSKPQLRKYLKSEKRPQLAMIDEESNDTSIAVKMALDAGILKQQQAMKITRLITALKRYAIDDLDMQELRELVSDPRILRNLTGKYKQNFAKYLEGDITIYQMFFNLRNVIRSDFEVADEFKSFNKYYKELLRKAAGIKDEPEDEDSEEGEE